jgi:hypothetical protein
MYLGHVVFEASVPSLGSEKPFFPTIPQQFLTYRPTLPFHIVDRYGAVGNFVDLEVKHLRDLGCISLEKRGTHVQIILNKTLIEEMFKKKIKSSTALLIHMRSQR